MAIGSCWPCVEEHSGCQRRVNFDHMVAIKVRGRDTTPVEELKCLEGVVDIKEQKYLEDVEAVGEQKLLGGCGDCRRQKMV